MRIKKGDNVRVISGKDKGREGKVERIMSKSGEVIVAGIGAYKKHIKGKQGQKGGIFDLVRPIDVSKISFVCPKCKKVSRIGYKFIKNEKLRICKKCGKEIDLNK